MQTFKRICLKDYEYITENDEIFKIELGKEYITSAVNESSSLGPEPVRNHVIVFSNYWAPVPVSIFGGEIEFSKN